MAAAVEETRNRLLEDVDASLDALLASPSSTPRQFADKIRALESEYGCDWQPRHIQSLIADLTVLTSASATTTGRLAKPNITETAIRLHRGWAS
jgi:hypothetical protein